METLKPGRKLDEGQKRKIAYLYASGEHSHKTLAELFGVAGQTIGDILSGRTKKSSRTQELSQLEIQEIDSMSSKGIRVREIAEKFDISHRTVTRVIRRQGKYQRLVISGE